MLYYIISLCYIILYYIILYYAKVCYVILYYIILYYIIYQNSYVLRVSKSHFEVAISMVERSVCKYKHT